MKMRSLFKILLITLALALFAGCRTAPIYNVDNAPVVSSTGKALSSTQVRDAIIHAGTSLGWQMAAKTPGHIIGTLYLRGTMAQVDIKYSPKSYSIEYKNSEKLKYDGKNIHKNYNGWIMNLQNRINAQLTGM